MLIYEKYGIEKSDAYNYVVVKYKTTSTGNTTKTTLTYHGDFLSSLTRIRKNIHLDSMSDTRTVDKYIELLKKLDDKFIEHMTSLDTKKIAELLKPAPKISQNIEETAA